MKRKGLLSVVLATCLVGVTLVGATFAYFQDVTQEKVNTFTVGGVNINLLEPSWHKENGIDLYPGAVVAKDPRISNVGKSDGYIVMKISGMDRMTQTGFSAVYDNENWDKVDAQGNVANTDQFALADGYYVYKGGALAPGKTTAPLFKEVVLSEDATEVTGENYKIMGKFRDDKGLFSYEDANGKEIAANVDREPTVFNTDGTPTIVYTIEGVAGKTFATPAEAEKYISENVKDEVGFKFDLVIQGYAIQTDFEDGNGNVLPFNPYTNWFTKLITK